MKNPLNTKGLLMGLALTITVLVMVPLITGAAPLTPPPTGTIVPTFSGENIKNSGGTTTLNISGDGLISNPSTGSVTIKDTDGMQIYGEGVGANYYSISPTDGISAKSTGAGTPAVRIRDDEGLEIVNAFGSVGLKIDNEGKIKRPDGNPVTIDDTWIQFQNTATPGGNLSFMPTKGAIENNGPGTVNIDDPHGFQVLSTDDGLTGGLDISAIGNIKNPSVNPVKITDSNGFQIADDAGTTVGLEFTADGKINRPAYIQGVGPDYSASITQCTVIYYGVWDSATHRCLLPFSINDSQGLSINNDAGTAALKIDGNGDIYDMSGSVTVKDALDVIGSGGSNVDINVTGRVRSGSDGNHGGGMWVGKEGVDYSLFMGQVDNSRIGFWNNGAWRFVVDSWGNYYNPSKNFTVDDNLDVTGYIETPDKTIDGVSYTSAMCTADGGEVYMTGGAGTTIWVCLLPVRTNAKLTADRLEANYINAKTTLSSNGKITATGGFGTLNKVSTENFALGTGSYYSASAACSSGQMLLSCGYYARDPVTVTAYRINPDTALSSCTVSFRNTSGAVKYVDVYAVCLNPAA